MEVEGDRRKGGRREIDIRRRPGFYGDLAGDGRGRDDRNVARGIEAPEARIDEEQPDRDEPLIVGRYVARRPVGSEFSDTGTENDQVGKHRAASDGMDDAASIGVMVAPKFYH